MPCTQEEEDDEENVVFYDPVSREVLSFHVKRVCWSAININPWKRGSRWHFLLISCLKWAIKTGSRQETTWGHHDVLWEISLLDLSISSYHWIANICFMCFMCECVISLVSIWLFSLSWVGNGCWNERHHHENPKYKYELSPQEFVLLLLVLHLNLCRHPHSCRFLGGVLFIIHVWMPFLFIWSSTCLSWLDFLPVYPWLLCLIRFTFTCFDFSFLSCLFFPRKLDPQKAINSTYLFMGIWIEFILPLKNNIFLSIQWLN